MTSRLLDRDTLRMYVMIADQFSDEELRTSKFHTSATGPVVWSGGRAAVFRATTVAGRSIAVRISVTASGDVLGVPYKALEAWANENPLPCFARSQWVDDGLQVFDEPVSLLKMDWIDGLTLEQYVDQCVASGSHDSVLALAEEWRETIAHMAAARIAHGDVHAENIMILGSGDGPRLRFVDYDSIWLPGLTTEPAEVGHPAFQHPERSWGEHMDAFGATVVYLSLRAVGLEPSLWTRYHADEMTLILEASDLRYDGRNLLAELTTHRDDLVRRMANIVRDWYNGAPNQHRSLEEVVSQPPGMNVWPPRPAPAPERAPAPAPAGPTPPVGTPDQSAKSPQQWPGASPQAGSVPPPLPPPALAGALPQQVWPPRQPPAAPVAAPARTPASQPPETPAQPNIAATLVFVAVVILVAVLLWRGQ
jgi:hypothetical protein